MSHISHINDNDFDARVLDRSGVSIVDFWAPWCAPCRSIGIVLEECSAAMQHIEFFKINVDDNSEVPSRYQVRGIPTLLLIKDGKLIDTKVGALSTVSFKEWLLQHNIT